MRRRLVPLLLAPMFLVLAPTSASAAASAPPSTDAATAAKIAATWLAHQVNDQGFIPLAGDPNTPNLSNSAQAVLALEAAGVGRTQVDALLAYLGAHVDEVVVHFGNDDPGALAYLILGAVAAGDDPTDFGSGHVDLVARLEATAQPDGLFGANDATYDGTFRQGLALLALHAAGESSSAGADWLVDQQCADGTWTSFRDDTSVACGAFDFTSFTGPDTNSTALAILGLTASGRTAPAAAGVTALEGVRTADGAWGFVAEAGQPTDANSTGVVVAALRAANGTSDAQGVAALLALQAGCDADPIDIGGIAFQSSPDGLVPDVLATDQAVLGLADVVLPQAATKIATDLVDPCPAAETTTTTATTVVDDEVEGTETTRSGELARSGSSSTRDVGIGLLLIGVGGVVVQLAQDRRRRFS